MLTEANEELSLDSPSDEVKLKEKEKGEKMRNNNINNNINNKLYPSTSKECKKCVLKSTTTTVITPLN